MLTGLSFLGRHARLALPFGILIALCLPKIDLDWDIILPVIIMIIYGVSIIRLDLMAVFLSAIKPARLIISLGLSGFILVLIPLFYSVLARQFGLPNSFMPALIWYAVAPPIAATVWMCSLLRFNTAMAIEIVVVSSLLAPFTGPFLATFFLEDIAHINSFWLFLQLTTMIFGGIILALMGRALLGHASIEKHRTVFDGISTLALLIFLVPVFNGVASIIADSPYLALKLLGLAILMNMGAQIVMLVFGYLIPSKPIQSASKVMAVVTGNRNVGLYFAALPAEPVLGLFTAMYQVPLYLTPLLLGWLSGNLRTRT